MYSWLLTPLLLLNKGIPTTFLGRLPQALVGILTLWCVYCLVKEMFGHTAGLWALFALSVCPWHIMACRWALDANMAPGFLMFGLYFFVRGMNDNRYLLLSALFLRSLPLLLRSDLADASHPAGSAGMLRDPLS